MNDRRAHQVALVVDDEIFARLFAVQIFLDHGFTVLDAADATEGLDKLERNDDITVLFTDISMPGDLDGLDLVAQARALRPEIALVLTSGRVAPRADETPDGVRFLPKPYTAQGLLETIREIGSPVGQ